MFWTNPVPKAIQAEGNYENEWGFHVDMDINKDDCFIVINDIPRFNWKKKAKPRQYPFVGWSVPKTNDANKKTMDDGLWVDIMPVGVNPKTLDNRFRYNTMQSEDDGQLSFKERTQVGLATVICSLFIYIIIIL